MKKEDNSKNLDPSQIGSGPADEKTAQQTNQPVGTNGLGYNREFIVGPISILAINEGFRLRHGKVGDDKDRNPANHDGTAGNNGLGFNGEVKIGAITLALHGDGGLRLRHENVGTETEVDTELVAKVIDENFFEDHKNGKDAEREVNEAALEGVLEDAFFTRRIDKAGKESTGDALK